MLLTAFGPEVPLETLSNQFNQSSISPPCLGDGLWGTEQVLSQNSFHHFANMKDYFQLFTPKNIIGKVENLKSKCRGKNGGYNRLVGNLRPLDQPGNTLLSPKKIEMAASEVTVYTSVYN